MKISELFVELGFDVKNIDKLKEVEKSLVDAAVAAEMLVNELKKLAAMKIPSGLQGASQVIQKVVKVSPEAISQQAAAASSAPLQGPPAPPPMLPQVYGPPAPPPILPQQPQQGTGTQVMTFMRNMWKGLGFLGLAMSIKQLISTIKEMGLAAMRAQVEMKQMTQQTSMSREEIKQWEYVGKLAGMSAEEVHSQMLAITDMANAMRYLMHPGPQPSLGIPMQSMLPGQIIQEFTRRMQGRPAAEQRMFAQAYGIDPRLILSLQNNPRAMEEGRKRIEANKDQLDAISSLNESFVKLKTTIDEQVMVSLGKIAPYLTQFATFLETVVKVLGFKFGPSVTAPVVGMLAGSAMRDAFVDSRSRSKLAEGPSRPNVTMNNQTTVNGVEKPNEVARAVNSAISSASERMFSDNYWQSPVYSGFGTSAVFDIPQ